VFSFAVKKAELSCTVIIAAMSEATTPDFMDDTTLVMPFFYDIDGDSRTNLDGVFMRMRSFSFDRLQYGCTRNSILFSKSYCFIVASGGLLPVTSRFID